MFIFFLFPNSKWHSFLFLLIVGQKYFDNCHIPAKKKLSHNHEYVHYMYVAMVIHTLTFYLLL